MSDATLASTAQRLIAKRGKSMTLRRKRGDTYVDPAKPWRGHLDDSSDLTVNAVVVPLEQRQNAGDRWQDGSVIRLDDQEAYVSGPAVTSGDIRPGDMLIDGSTTYQIRDARQYAPGSTSILWKLGVRR